MRLAEDASNERGAYYTGPAPEVLPRRGIFSDFFLNAVMSSRPTQSYEFGPFVLNVAEQTLLRDGLVVPLRPKVFDILLALVERHGRLVGKDELMRAVWDEEFVEEGNLNKNISLLRKALGEGVDGRQYIETAPKRGYRFAADVREVGGDGGAELVVETLTRTSLVVEEEETDEPAAEMTAAPARPAGKFRRWAVPAAAVVLVALAAAVYLFYPRRGGAVDSVAVLPFVNEGGDPEVEYLSDGISESLINSLSQISGVKVIAHSSSFRYKGQEVDPREAARSLGVEAILTGRVSRRGDQLQISVELMDALDNRHIWGERYSRSAADVFAVQAEISREIAGKLRLRLTPGDEQQLARRETVNPVAYELLLKGRFYSNKATESQKRAIEYFNQAIAVDPDYALAYAELSLTYSELINVNVLDPKEFTPKAEMAALKALELDENLAQAHLALADVRTYAWEWEAAEREFRRAIELNPNLARAHHSYMFYLIIRGRNEEALAEGRRARELDPLSAGASTAPVYEWLLASQFDRAIEAAQQLLERDRSNPNLHALLAFTYLRKGQYPEAIAVYKEAIKLGDDSRDTQILLAQAYARVGEPEKTRAMLRQLEAGKEYVSPATLAILYAALGERDQAFALLERAYSVHDQQLIWLGVERGFDPLRSDPRFREIMRRVGLAA